MNKFGKLRERGPSAGGRAPALSLEERASYAMDRIETGEDVDGTAREFLSKALLKLDDDGVRARAEQLLKG